MEDVAEEAAKDYDSVGAVAKLASSGRYSTVMQVNLTLAFLIILAQTLIIALYMH